jgi:hypothetical protein
MLGLGAGMLNAERKVLPIEGNGSPFWMKGKTKVFEKTFPLVWRATAGN